MKTGKWLLLAVLGMLAALAAQAAGPRAYSQKLSGMPEETAAALAAAAWEQMEALHTPGLGVGVVVGNTLAYQGYFGQANREQDRPVDESSLFRIGSISKSLTTIGLLQQFELGKFALDDDINQYLPEPLVFPPDSGQKVTFRQLLTHTSGVGEFLSYGQVLMPGQGVRVEGDNYLPLAHYLRFGAHNRVPPGKKYAYSNYGFGFLGLALEHLSGQPFHLYMRDRVFLPLGMKDTTFQHTAALLPRIVTGYSWSQKGYQARAHNAYGVTPSGNIYSTVADFGLYVQALLNGGANPNARVIKPETLAMMMAPQHTFDERQGAYGFGLRVYGRVWGHRVIGHSGSVPFGYHSYMLLAPDDRVGVYVFGNGESDTCDVACWRLLKILLNGRDDPLPSFAPDRKYWKQLEGYYGPRYGQFKTSTRIYMANIGAYQVKVVGEELKLIYAWQGAEKARTLLQATPGDPLFFVIREPGYTGTPNYVSFHQDPDGGWVFVTGGVDEYIKLPPARRLRAQMMIPLGRALTRVNPF